MLAPARAPACRLRFFPWNAPSRCESSGAFSLRSAHDERYEFYADWAERIARGQWTDFHAFYGQPLYAYLAGAVFALAGFQPFWLGLLQACLDAITSVLIFEIALLVFGEGSPRRGVVVALLAVAGWIFYLPAAAYCGLLIPAAFPVTTWWFVVWWLLRRRVAARGMEWCAVALLIGFSALISAATLLLLALFLPALFWRPRPRPWAILGVVAGVTLGTAPAWAHNAFVARDPVFISAHGGVNFWIGNNPEANGYPKIPSDLPSEQAELLAGSIRVAEVAAGQRLPHSSVSEYWSAKARNYIGSHFSEWLILEGIKIKNFWSNFAYDDLSTITPLRDAGILPPGIRFGLLAALGLPGALFAWRNRRARWILAAITLQMLALLPVFINERYRLPAAPGLLLLDAFFLTELWFHFSRAHWRPALLAGAALLAATLFVSFPPRDPALLSIDDFKAGRRELLAYDFGHAERRLRLAAAVAVPPAQVTSAIVQIFAEVAREKWQAGDQDAARAIVAAALHIAPENAPLQRLSFSLKTAQPQTP